MRARAALLGSSLLAGLLTAGAAAAWLAEFGIEGMRVVSTAANEIRATVSPDGQRIVWGSSGRSGGAGGQDLWQARLAQGRWQDARPLEINSERSDAGPMFSADGRWLYFHSDREGGAGGDDLYRAAVRADGYGPPENLGRRINSGGDERTPTPSADGRHLLFASDGQGGDGGLDLWVASRHGRAFVEPHALAGINTGADEFDGAWLGDGGAIVFARSDDADTGPVRLQLAQCDGRRYTDSMPMALSFNGADGTTRGPALDWSKPGELLVSGSARSPRAGGLDVYRMKAPAVSGGDGCIDPPTQP